VLFNFHACDGMMIVALATVANFLQTLRVRRSGYPRVFWPRIAVLLGRRRAGRPLVAQSFSAIRRMSLLQLQSEIEVRRVDVPGKSIFRLIGSCS
jgi:hypothetical protein